MAEQRESENYWQPSLLMVRPGALFRGAEESGSESEPWRCAVTALGLGWSVLLQTARKAGQTKRQGLRSRQPQ